MAASVFKGFNSLKNVAKKRKQALFPQQLSLVRAPITQIATLRKLGKADLASIWGGFHFWLCSRPCFVNMISYACL